MKIETTVYIAEKAALVADNMCSTIMWVDGSKMDPLWIGQGDSLHDGRVWNIPTLHFREGQRVEISIPSGVLKFTVQGWDYSKKKFRCKAEWEGKKNGLEGGRSAFLSWEADLQDDDPVDSSTGATTLGEWRRAEEYAYRMAAVTGISLMPVDKQRLMTSYLGGETTPTPEEEWLDSCSEEQDRLLLGV